MKCKLCGNDSDSDIDEDGGNETVGYEISEVHSNDLYWNCEYEATYWQIRKMFYKNFINIFIR